MNEKALLWVRGALCPEQVRAWVTEAGPRLHPRGSRATECLSLLELSEFVGGIHRLCESRGSA